MLNKLIKYGLDSIGPGFCLAKWTNSTIHLGMGMNHSCHHPNAHLVPVEEVVIDSSALHNSLYKKQQRDTMLSGQRPSECQYCWNIEDNSNEYSDRVLMSSQLDSLPHFFKIKGTNQFDPTNLEISFSNVCNFACAYCSPEFSSKWLSDINTHGPYLDGYHGQYRTQILDKEYNPYIEAFWDYLPKIYHDLRVLRITGGEPLLSKHTDRLFEFIKRNPNNNLTLTINTNLGVEQKILDAFLLKLLSVNANVKQVNIATSGEATHDKANYIRDGLSYSKWLANCTKVLSVHQDVKFFIMSAYNVFSITSYTEFAKDIAELRKTFGRRVTLTVTYVNGPDFLSASTAPLEWKHYLDESYKFIKQNFSKLTAKRFKHVMIHFESATRDPEQLVKLKRFVAEYDQRRSKNFKETFPEYDFV